MSRWIAVRVPEGTLMMPATVLETFSDFLGSLKGGAQSYVPKKDPQLYAGHGAKGYKGLKLTPTNQLMQQSKPIITVW